MGLIERSEAFLATSLENSDYFGWPVVLTNLLGVSQVDLKCQARHINMLIDMETGQEIQSEQASITLRLSSITIGEPVKGWTGTVTDTGGISYNFKVIQALPDRTIGIVVLKLGLPDS